MQYNHPTLPWYAMRYTQVPWGFALRLLFCLMVRTNSLLENSLHVSFSHHHITHKNVTGHINVVHIIMSAYFPHFNYQPRNYQPHSHEWYLDLSSYMHRYYIDTHYKSIWTSINTLPLLRESYSESTAKITDRIACDLVTYKPLTRVNVKEAQMRQEDSK